MVQRYAKPIVAAAFIVAAAGGYYAVGHLTMRTSTADMLSPDLPFRKLDREFEAAFPTLDGNLAILVTADTADQAEDAALALTGALQERSDLFDWIYFPLGDSFFRQNGLLFLDIPDLEKLSDRLAAAEPLLGELARDMTLRGLFGVLGLAAKATVDRGERVGDLDRVLASVGDTVEGELNGRSRPLSWRALMSPDPLKPGDYHQIILAQVGAGQAALSAIPQIAENFGLDESYAARVQLTGDAPIGADEVSAVREGGKAAGVISIALVSVIAFFGVRSFRLVMAMILTVVLSLVWTSAFAALVIGHLNILSAAFAVLFIGITMDFCVQVGLRFREARTRGRELSQSLREAVSHTGVAVTLAAFAAAIGFFSFVATAYLGLAELGIISGVGMIIGLFATLTLLPALLTLMPIAARPGPPATDKRENEAGRFVERHARAISLATLALGCLSLAAVPHVGFEVDPVKLNDPNSKSVKAYDELLSDSSVSPYSINILAPELKSADALADRLKLLSLVGDVITLGSFVPQEQEKKLHIIDLMSDFLLPVIEPGDTLPPPSLTDNQAALQTVLIELDRLGASPQAGSLAALATRLATLLRAFAAKSANAASGYRDLDRALLRNLPGRLRSLQESMNASRVTLASLPANIKSRYLSADGRARIEVSPKRRFAGSHDLRRFVDQVRAIAPNAIGTAVYLLDGADTVVHAFTMSGVLAFVGVSLLLLLVLRSAVDWLLVAIPLLLALSFTVAVAVLLDTKLNLANIMALPLLFSLGSAFGVYLVMRNREVTDVAQLAGTSTPRAVVASALITMASFGSLMVSNDRGMASMGELLAISLAMALIANLIALPAMLAWRAHRKGQLQPRAKSD